MESENTAIPEAAAENDNVEAKSPTSIQKEDDAKVINWEEVNRRKYYQFQNILHNGSEWMEPSDIMSLRKQTTYICYKNDPYSEMYYHIKVREKEQGATLDTSRVSPFLSNYQKNAIRQESLNKSIMAKSFAKYSKTLGVVERRNYRLQTPQLVLDNLQLDEESNSKATHLRVLNSIESGYSALLKIEQTNERIQKCDNPLSLFVLKSDLDNANKQLLGAFFIENKESGLEVKPKWLMRVMSIRKGKKLLIQSCPFFTQQVWQLLLSYILPYILIWTDDNSQEDVDRVVIQMIKELLNSQYVDLTFITNIMEMFIKLNTVRILPDLLNAEPYSDVIVLLFNRGDALFNDLMSKEKTPEEEEITNKWTGIMKLLEASVADDDDDM